jgi:nucleotide-binding universal stress UspA family protein
MTKIIISYDDTSNDRDAAVLGRLLTAAGATPELAYVRHASETDHEREQLQEAEARELLARGADLIGNPDAPVHVVLNKSTSEGLRGLTQEEHADIIVFGSDYRTARGSVNPGNSARKLLEGGPAAVAIAPSGLHTQDQLPTIERIAVIGDTAAQETADSLAAALGARVTEPGESPVDLLVVGSRPEAQQGQVSLSAAAEYAVETSSCAVLVVPHGTPVAFGSRATATA